MAQPHQLRLLPTPVSGSTKPSTAIPDAQGRLLELGASALTNAELLELLLACPRAAALAEQLAAKPLTTAIHGKPFRESPIEDDAKARLLAAVELANRMAQERLPKGDILDRPDAVANYLTLKYAATCPDQELMGAIYLNTRNRYIDDRVLYRGTMGRAAVEPRAILKTALELSAHGFVLFHSHPSGDPSPSADDLTFTRRIAEAGDMLGIKLLDHMILGSAGRWVSLGRRGAW